MWKRPPHRDRPPQTSQLLRRAADRAFLGGHDAFHGERAAHAHHPAHDLGLVHQFLLLGVGGNAGVDLVHLCPPGRPIRPQRLLRRWRPVRVGVERHFPFVPAGKVVRHSGVSVPGAVVRRQQPAPAVGVRDGLFALAVFLFKQLAAGFLAQRGRDQPQGGSPGKRSAGNRRPAFSRWFHRARNTRPRLGGSPV